MDRDLERENALKRIREMREARNQAPKMSRALIHSGCLMLLIGMPSFLLSPYRYSQVGPTAFLIGMAILFILLAIVNYWAITQGPPAPTLHLIKMRRSVAAWLLGSVLLLTLGLRWVEWTLEGLMASALVLISQATGTYCASIGSPLQYYYPVLSLIGIVFILMGINANEWLLLIVAVHTLLVGVAAHFHERNQPG